MRPLVPAVLAALAAVAVSAGDASAYEALGRPWPGGEIRYHVEDGGLRKPVKRAARIWNRRQVGVRFAGSSEENARVFIAYGQRSCGGAATVGYQGRRRAGFAEIAPGCSTGLTTLTAVHELGHVLGLGHETEGCARMNPTFDGSGTPGGCERRSLAYWLDHR